MHCPGESKLFCILIMVIGMIKDSQGMDEMKNPCLVLYVNLTEAISTDGLLLTDICKISFNGVDLYLKLTQF